MPQDAYKFPLQEDFKPGFASAMRLMGVISYQLVYRLDGESPEIGQRVDHRLYRISPVQELTASKTLRDRGIKVIHAGFSELRPTDPTIYQQRVENWRARWQQEADIIQADHDLEVMRIRNQAKAEKQHEIILKLSEILGSSAYSEEAVILRIFKALEDAAADPQTLQLLPKDTINLLRSLRLWMLPDEGARSSLLEEMLSSSEDKE